MIGDRTANRAIYVYTIEARADSRNVDFCSALALDFGLHIYRHMLLIDEINGS